MRLPLGNAWPSLTGSGQPNTKESWSAKNLSFKAVVQNHIWPPKGKRSIDGRYMYTSYSGCLNHTSSSTTHAHPHQQQQHSTYSTTPVLDQTKAKWVKNLSNKPLMEPMFPSQLGAQTLLLCHYPLCKEITSLQ